MEITYDQKKLKRVRVEEVRPNDWNPKKDNTEEYERIVQSVAENGQRIPIVVREYEGLDDNKTPYQIIDGEQRFKACVHLGFEEVLVYNEGIMGDNEAKALTIWYQQQVPFDRILEAHLVNDIQDVKLPYSLEELEEFRQIVEFDWTQVELEEHEEVEIRTLTLRLLKEAYEIVMRAITIVQEMENVNTERALELICADYLASVNT